MVHSFVAVVQTEESPEETGWGIWLFFRFICVQNIEFSRLF